jgi:metal-dependent amidase/aminoacylase/carboxypeptidase family protein
LDFLASYPPVLNARGTNRLLRAAGRDLFGAEAVIELETPSMGGEDFAHYLERVPGAMFFLGVGNKKLGAIHNWHHPQFKADENAIPIGAALLAKAAIDFLNE